MEQKSVFQNGGEPNPLDTGGLCLLSLDGGGVRGLSSLYILKGLMTLLNNKRKDSGKDAVKPCEMFDLIGGTSTGGLIAIMLGRLEMDVDECIEKYARLMEAIFEKKTSRNPFSLFSKVEACFDSANLKKAIEDVISSKGIPLTDAFNDGNKRGCHTFVCATAKETAGITHLRSYTVLRESDIPATICQAALATSAATSFFDPVSIGARQFVDGALGANNPVDEVEGEAANLWCPDTSDLKPLVKCFVSIGTGHPGKKAIEDRMFSFLSKSLVSIATETENTERKFVARWAKHYDEKRFFRFNVQQGLHDVGLAEYKEKGKIEVVTSEYLHHQAQKFQVRDCVQNLAQKQNATELNFNLTVSESNEPFRRQIRATAADYVITLSKNPYFVGRESELDTLEQRLLVEQDCQKMSIVGLGGTGKTQVALKFAYTVKETKPEFSVFWLSAVSMESFEQTCGDVARKLGILPAMDRGADMGKLGTSQKVDQKEDVRELVKRHLSAVGTGQRWLLVLDNADDRDLVLGTTQSRGIVSYLPQSEHGIILYTTRTKKMAQELTRADTIKLGPMERQDAEEFMKKLLGDNSLVSDGKAMAELLDELADLPLAISQAAAYLNANETSVREYLGLLRNTEQDLVDLMSEEFYDNTRYPGSSNAVATTWIVSFRQIRERNGSAADLLAFISCIEWKAIPRSLLPQRDMSKVKMETAIGMLCEYSFLAKREQGGPGEKTGTGGEAWYDMHRLVHLATGVWRATHPEMAGIPAQAQQHITQLFPNSSWKHQALWQAYMPHALHVLRSPHFEKPDVKARLSMKVGKCFQAEGRYRDAVTWCEASYRWTSKHLKEDDKFRLASAHELAVTYGFDGQIKNAIKLLEHVNKKREKSLAGEYPDRIQSQHELAGVYLLDGQVKKAISLLEQVVRIEEKVLSEEHSERLASQHALARAYLEDGQIKRAITLFEQVVQIREKTLSEEHSERLASQHELARAYLEDRQVKRAIPLFEQVVQIQEKTLAEEHPGRLTSQHELARAYLNDGQVKRAITLYKQVVQIQEKTLAEEHPGRLKSQHELARAYLNDRQIKRAITLFEQVVQIQEKTLAEDHTDRLLSQHELARAFLENRQLKEAIALSEHVVGIRARVFREDHPELLKSQHNLALTFSRDRQVKKGIALMELVVDARTRTNDPYLSGSQHALALMYKTDGQIKRGIALMEVVVAARTQNTDPGLLLSQHELAFMCYYGGQPERGITLMEHVVEVGTQVLPGDDPTLVTAKKNLQIWRAEQKIQPDEE